MKRCEDPEDEYDDDENQVVATNAANKPSCPAEAEKITEDADFFLEDWSSDDENGKGLSRSGGSTLEGGWGITLEERVERDNEAMEAFLDGAKNYGKACIKRKRDFKKLASWSTETSSPGQAFDIPFDVAPTYGHHRAVHSRKAFRCCEGGLLIRKGELRVTDEEARECALPSAWLGAIFLAERGTQGAFLFRFDGVEVSSNRVRQQNLDADCVDNRKKRKEKGAPAKQKTTHVLQVGHTCIDASDTAKYPNGLLNTNPGGPNSCVWGSSRYEEYQKHAPYRSARNVFLSKDCPAGTLLTIDYGSGYFTKGFVKLSLFPTNSEWKAFATGSFRSSRMSKKGEPLLFTGKKPKRKKKSSTGKKRKTLRQQQEMRDAQIARQMQFGMRGRRRAAPT
eukprot:CAMPEP_0170169286 /NCGR_PEP_ID=MMETSP0040_2-20121228/2198_1 /TAXON_ID=641309 /ORGANISM="Lotharella oceanica, Strain CCMP622" /LENGTH=393 /DNA_ID=CAMNT_0010407927 /DNA_START=51 /DNA_END=1232 /DNA_ORIENTATION=-